jgi:hypothetical protein
VTDESNVPEDGNGEALIAAMELKCVVCQAVLPAGRATSRSKFTCGKVCRDRWKAYQKFQRENKRCNFCHAPSTPKERKMYRAFRKSLGQLRQGPGKPVSDQVRGRQREFMEALRQAIEYMEWIDTKLRHGVGITHAEYADVLASKNRFQNLVDGKGWVRRTLPESGDAAAASKGDDDGISSGQAVGAGIGLGERGEPDTDEHRSAAHRAAAGDAESD